MVPSRQLAVVVLINSDTTEPAGTIAFATEPQFVYQHRWTVGDLVMWDNRCTMHRGRPYDDTQRRVLHRTTVSDTANTLEQEGLTAIAAA